MQRKSTLTFTTLGAIAALGLTATTAFSGTLQTDGANIFGQSQVTTIAQSAAGGLIVIEDGTLQDGAISVSFMISGDEIASYTIASADVDEGLLEGDADIMANALESMRPADGNGFVPGMNGLLLATDVPTSIPGVNEMFVIQEASATFDTGQTLLGTVGSEVYQANLGTFSVPQPDQGTFIVSMAGLIEVPAANAIVVDFAALNTDATAADMIWTAALDELPDAATTFQDWTMAVAMGSDAATTWTVLGSGAQA